MEYIVRGLPNQLKIQVKLIYEDNLGKLQSVEQNYLVNYGEQIQKDQISLESNCSLHANQIGFSAIPGELFASTWTSASKDGDLVEIEQGGTVEYKKLNEETDIEIHDGSTILIRMQFGYDLVNPSGFIDGTDPSKTQIVEVQTDNSGYKVKID